MWQVLPLVPPGAGESPYSSWSAFACSPWLIDLEDLANRGLLDQSDLQGYETRDPSRIDFESMRAFKGPRLEKAADNFLKGQSPLYQEFLAFKKRSPWLAEAALFKALNDEQQQPWWMWPKALRLHQDAAVAEARERLKAQVERAEALQFFFDWQWRTLRQICKDAGVQLIGDLPIYVDANSADVWANQSMFELDEEGQRTDVSGVPPDAFSAEGQLWGNPLYRWDAMAKDHYSWWVRRLRRAFELCDIIRIDHFRAFAAYWSVPASATSAKEGHWIKGPGMALFDALKKELGQLPIIAEDLGIIDEEVCALLKDTGFPGMKVLQFAFGGTPDNLYLPHNHTQHSVIYTGTPDNNTTLGWWFEASPREQDYVRRYFSIDGNNLVWDMIRAAFASVGETAIVPVQDILCLDASGRMNTPSVANGNWSWRMKEGSLNAYHAGRLRELVYLYHRHP